MQLQQITVAIKTCLYGDFCWMLKAGAWWYQAHGWFSVFKSRNNVSGYMTDRSFYEKENLGLRTRAVTFQCAPRRSPRRDWSHWWHPGYCCHTTASMAVLSRLLHRVSLLSPSSAAVAISLWIWMPALHIATNSNHLYHFYNCVIILISRKEYFWLAALWFHSTLITCSQKEKTHRERQAKAKTNERKENTVSQVFWLYWHGRIQCQQVTGSLLCFFFQAQQYFLYTSQDPFLFAILTRVVVVPCPVARAETSRGHLPAAIRARGWHCTCWMVNRRLGITFSRIFCADSFWCQVLLQDSNDQNRDRSHTEGAALVLLTQPRRQSWVVAVHCAHRKATGAAHRGLHHVFSRRNAHRSTSSPTQNTMAFFILRFELVSFPWDRLTAIYDQH